MRTGRSSIGIWGTRTGLGTGDWGLGTGDWGLTLGRCLTFSGDAMSEDIDGAGDIGPTGGETARQGTSARTFDPPRRKVQSSGDPESRVPSPQSPTRMHMRMPAEWE